MAKDVQVDVTGSGKPIVFYIANSWNLNTGYAKCVREICNRIGLHDYEICHMGQHSLGDAYKPEGWNFTVHPLKDEGTVLLQHQIDQLHPAAVIFQDDLFTLVDEGINRIDFSNTKLILYSALDGEPLADNAHLILDKADKIIAMTEWGKGVLEGAGYEDIEVIYHGLDTDIWKPEPDKEKRKVELGNFLSGLFQHQVDFTNKFIVYTSGRNTLRKNIPEAIHAFIKFAKDIPEAQMIIHSVKYMRPDNMLPLYVKQFCKIEGADFNDIQNRIIFYPAQSFQRACPESQMVVLANIADVFFTMSWGEGFGMQMLESMAVGTPVISAEYSTPTELIGDKRGMLVKCDRWLYVQRGIGHNLPNVDDAASKLNDAYKLWKKGELETKYKDECIKFATQFTWDNVCQDWVRIIKEVIE